MGTWNSEGQSGEPRRRADLNNHEFLKSTARSDLEKGGFALFFKIQAKRRRLKIQKKWEAKVLATEVICGERVFFCGVHPLALGLGSAGPWRYWQG
ncbi:hypothetical protein [Fretibacterium fastidiosum]|nr:hypothetical protein [Fretibacterium fastidiosum]